MASALTEILSDARERIAKRYESDGDTERTREFAHTVTAPIARAHDKLGLDFDAAAFIKEAAHA